MSGFNTREEFFGALRENRDRAAGRARAAIAEEIAEAAEAFGDDEVTATALVELMGAYHGSGESVKYPVAFARLLRLWDTSPKAFDDWETHRVFWYFKWVGSGLLDTPEVPLDSIRGWIGEMRKRYQAAGHGLQPVYGQLYALADHVGQGEESAYELWATRGRVRMSDCEACEARSRAGYYFDRGQDERGLLELEATLDGRSNCDEEPQSSQARALLPLVRQGRLDQARGAHLASYRAVRGKEANLHAVGRHLEFCALTGNEARGLELLAQNRTLFGFTSSPLGRLAFLTGAEVLLRRLAEVGHGGTPCGGPLGREWTVQELLASVAAEADELAARFDARNGTAAVSERRARRLRQRPLVAELNLGVRSAALENVETGPGAAESVPVGGSAVSAGAMAAAASQNAVIVPPEDFAELVAEVRRLDRNTHPSARTLWNALLERADGADADKVDDVLRGEIANEHGSRAHGKRDWDEVERCFTEAAEHYKRAGRADRVIATEARILWSRAIRDQDADPSASAADVWPHLDALLERISALLAAGDFADADALREARIQSLVVRQSRAFAARNAALRAAEAQDRERWLAVFRRESADLIADAQAFGAPHREALAQESLAEYDATRDDPAAAEAAARRAIAIFRELDWPWRMNRPQMLLGLSLAGQDRYSEAVQVLQTGIAEAHPTVEPDELTHLYRLLGEAALQGGELATAVRTFAEAAVRLDREGDAFGAAETRWRMSNALSMQGQVADAVAVLETLVDVPLGDEEDQAEEVEAAGATSGTGDDADTADTAEDSDADARAAEDSDAAAHAAEDSDAEALTTGPTEPITRRHSHRKRPTRADMLMVQIRADLARGLLALDEPRAAAVEFLHVADAVDGWPDASRLTAAAAEAASALALARNWDGARAALERAIAANAVAPRVPDLTEALRDMAGEAMNTQGAEGLEEALGYLARADQLRAEFLEVARTQFVSVEVDEAQTCYTRGWVLNTAGRPDEAIAELERAVALYDRPGFSEIPPRYEAIRLAAIIEHRVLNQTDAAKARLDRGIAGAEASGHGEGLAMLQKLRSALK
ncbi:MAG: hypothetical protein HOW97_25540 [Catenulispora sp.]|nr:hypothetical protein [Catenulispora sp.]